MALQSKRFSGLLLHWHQTQNNRQMPWKSEADPYKIWLSEVMLQQTKVEQATNYYLKFIKNFATIQQLANAPQDVVFKLWEGLGYYSRCRNLIETAKNITQNYDGVFPNTYEGLLQLKGIGPYTAAAIASFAFNQPVAVVDGNVYRILSRVFGIFTPIDSTLGKTQFAQLAQQLLGKEPPAQYNQAIMDFGATVCKPKQPNCASCPLHTICTAFKKELVTELPVKTKKVKVTTRHLHYIILRYGKSLLVRQRTATDVWQNLHDFFVVENTTPQPLNSQQIAAQITQPMQLLYTSNAYKQKLTHQKIIALFYIVSLPTKIALPGYFWVTAAQFKKLPVPKIINQFLQEKSIFN
jgi:A/G-specific adenine glycosylase